MTIGDRIDETGLLLREGGGFQLRRDTGGRYELLLQSMPIDEVEKRVCVIGRYAGRDQIEVEGIQFVGRGAQAE